MNAQEEMERFRLFIVLLDIYIRYLNAEFEPDEIAAMLRIWEEWT